MSYSNRKEIFILVLCLLIGFALRFYTFDKKSLWMDEIYTFNDSRDALKAQIKFYKENPTFLHPPLFFILTHLFYPFEKPERDLRIIPLIFGTLSIPMFYLLAKQFSASIALPCALSLAFMTYHISLSQDGRSYSLLMFLGMGGLYFFMMHLQSSKRRYLIMVALFFAILCHTSYSSIPFIILSQILWFYRPDEKYNKPILPSFLILNGLILLFCLPWIIFVLTNYIGQPLMDSFHIEDPGTPLTIFYWILHDWVPFLPLMITSVFLLILFPFILKNKRNALILLGVFILPITGLYLFCKSLNLTHFVTSRYFINFLPLFFITLFLSLEAMELKFKILRRFMRLKLLFVILFIFSNLVFLPLYYYSEKQDLKSLANYLKVHLRPGDNIFDGHGVYMPGLLHYFGIYPRDRHYTVSIVNASPNEMSYKISFSYKNNIYTIYHSKICCNQYIERGNRLWIIVPKNQVKSVKSASPVVLKGYFDGSFLNFTKFPSDASMYLFLWDPNSPDEKGIDMPIE